MRRKSCLQPRSALRFRFNSTICRWSRRFMTGMESTQPTLTQRTIKKIKRMGMAFKLDTWQSSFWHLDMVFLYFQELNYFNHLTKISQIFIQKLFNWHLALQNLMIGRTGHLFSLQESCFCCNYWCTFHLSITLVKKMRLLHGTSISTKTWAWWSPE